MSVSNLPFILERVRRCEFCRREMPERSLGYQENPFCALCLNKRLLLAADASEPPVWRAFGDYVERITAAPRKPC